MYLYIRTYMHIAYIHMRMYMYLCDQSNPNSVKLARATSLALLYTYYIYNTRIYISCFLLNMYVRRQRYNNNNNNRCADAKKVYETEQLILQSGCVVERINFQLRAKHIVRAYKTTKQTATLAIYIYIYTYSIYASYMMFRQIMYIHFSTHIENANVQQSSVAQSICTQYVLRYI